MATMVIDDDDDRFNPYTDNGGTVLAVRGKDFAIIASDTRATEGYEILSRDAHKLSKVNSRIVLGTAGMRADAQHLTAKLQQEVRNYTYENSKEIEINEYAMLLSRNLYFRRFFPWYTFNIVAGIDAQGKGRVFSYDAVGCIGESMYAASGSGESMAITILDEALCPLISEKRQDTITKEEAFELIKRTFVAVTEREIYTGDSVVYQTITKSGIEEGRFELRKD